MRGHIELRELMFTVIRPYNTCMLLDVFPSSALFYSNTYFPLAVPIGGPPKSFELPKGTKKIIYLAENSPLEKRNILRPLLGAQVDKLLPNNSKIRTPIAKISAAPCLSFFIS